MDRSTINTLGLCAGVGMLDLGVAAGLEYLGFQPRATALCEWEAYAAACLLARMEESSLEPCPIFGGDLREFDAQPFRGLVDVIAAGLPCQPYSVAGKQRGNADERSHGEDGDGPIPQFLRIVSECRPAVVFCENVPPWVRKGWFRPVGEELSRLGYTIEDPLFLTAESVGASHRRERVFVMAYAPRERWRSQWAESARFERGTESVDVGVQLADAGSLGKGGKWWTSTRQPEQQSRRAIESSGQCDNMADTARTERTERAGRERVLDDDQAVAYAGSPSPHARSKKVRSRDDSAGESSYGLFAPGPNADWSGIPSHLWPSITGPLDNRELATALRRRLRNSLASGNRRQRRREAKRIADVFSTKAAAQPGFRVLVDGTEMVLDKSRADQLRCGGNGCVPLVAAVAFVELFQRVAAKVASGEWCVIESRGDR